MLFRAMGAEQAGGARQQMFEQLTTRVQSWVDRLRRGGTLSTEEIAASLEQLRTTLLDADVHLEVVTALLERVQSRAAQLRVQESLNAGDRIVALVAQELAALLGDRNRPLKLSPAPPTVIMLVGLQGSGKTTTAGKLARLLKQQGRRLLLVAADPRRPAATEQLQTIGRQLLVDVAGNPSDPPTSDATGSDAVVALCLAAVERARTRAVEVVIIDTAGRLQIDELLMAELQAIHEAVKPHEVWLVVDGMMGQEAVATARAFADAVAVTGLVMTKLDGDARGGALLSIRAMTGLPVTYIGTGEKLEALEPFHPDRMASRILGRGDLQSLMERVATVEADTGRGAELARKLRREELTLEDFRLQLAQMASLGPVEELLAMVPGGHRLKGRLHGAVSDGAAQTQMKRATAIINSMTKQERRVPDLLNGRRRLRIAKGSGTTVQEVNQLVRQFYDARRMMKHVAGRPERLSRSGRAGSRRMLGS
jgi:signal recognition particle subunit SRP54